MARLFFVLTLLVSYSAASFGAAEEASASNVDTKQTPNCLLTRAVDEFNSEYGVPDSDPDVDQLDSALDGNPPLQLLLAPLKFDLSNVTLPRRNESLHHFIRAPPSLSV